jgi:hypothetical protein
MSTVTVQTQDTAPVEAAPTTLTTHGWEVIPGFSNIGAKDTAKVHKADGDHTLVVGTTCVRIAGDSALGAYIDSSKLAALADKASADDLPEDAKVHAALVAVEAKAIRKAVSSDAWNARREAARLASSATGWNRAAYLRLACKGK